MPSWSRRARSAWCCSPELLAWHRGCWRCGRMAAHVEALDRHRGPVPAAAPAAADRRCRRPHDRHHACRCPGVVRDPRLPRRRCDRFDRRRRPGTIGFLRAGGVRLQRVSRGTRTGPRHFDLRARRGGRSGGAMTPPRSATDWAAASRSVTCRAAIAQRTHRRERDRDTCAGTSFR